MEPAGLWSSWASSVPVTAFLAERATLWAPWAAHFPTPATLLPVLVSDDPSGCGQHKNMVGYMTDIHDATVSGCMRWLVRRHEQVALPQASACSNCTCSPATTAIELHTSAVASSSLAGRWSGCASASDRACWTTCLVPAADAAHAGSCTKPVSCVTNDRGSDCSRAYLMVAKVL